MNLYELQMKLKEIMHEKELQLKELKECADSEVRRSYYTWAELMMKAHHKDLLNQIMDFNRRRYGSDNREN